MLVVKVGIWNGAGEDAREASSQNALSVKGRIKANRSRAPGSDDVSTSLQRFYPNMTEQSPKRHAKFINTTVILSNAVSHPSYR